MSDKLYKNMIKELKDQNKKISDTPINIIKTYDRLEMKSLVSFDEFQEYLTNDFTVLNKFISKRKQIEINNAITIRDKRYQKYKDIKSQIQFKTTSKSDIITENRLDEMLNYFIGPIQTRMVHILIEYNKTDDEILQFIKTNYDPKSNVEIKLYKIAQISDTIINYTKNEKIKILDVGIGNGKKTLQLESLIDCNIYGADVESWGQYKKRQFSFPFKTITFDPYKIPYPDKMFDCITILLVLHHCDDIIVTINECKRMLKDDGILLINEHDVWSDNTNMIIDLQHRIWASIANEDMNYVSTYYNFYEWDIIFNKCGMEPVYTGKIFEDISFLQRYDVQFISVYKKKQL